jgi:hypothetical protein
MPLAAPYLLSLCEAVEYSDFSFGVVSRLDTQKSTFELDAAKLIHSIVKYSPASESVAMEFLFEVQKISGINDSGMFPSSEITRSFFETYYLYSHCSRPPSIRRSAGTVGTTDIGNPAYTPA